MMRGRPQTHLRHMLIMVVVSGISFYIVFKAFTAAGGQISYGTQELTGPAPDAGLLIGMAVLVGLVAFLVGGLPIPVGYDRGKIKFLHYCGTGHHFHTVYWTENGLQSKHPGDTE